MGEENICYKVVYDSYAPELGRNKHKLYSSNYALIHPRRRSAAIKDNILKYYPRRRWVETSFSEFGLLAFSNVEWAQRFVATYAWEYRNSLKIYKATYDKIVETKNILLHIEYDDMYEYLLEGKTPKYNNTLIAPTNGAIFVNKLMLLSEVKE